MLTGKKLLTLKRTIVPSSSRSRIPRSAGSYTQVMEMGWWKNAKSLVGSSQFCLFWSDYFWCVNETSVNNVCGISCSMHYWKLLGFYSAQCNFFKGHVQYWALVLVSIAFNVVHVHICSSECHWYYSLLRELEVNTTVSIGTRLWTECPTNCGSFTSKNSSLPQSHQTTEGQPDASRPFSLDVKTSGTWR